MSTIYKPRIFTPIRASLGGGGSPTARGSPSSARWTKPASEQGPMPKSSNFAGNVVMPGFVSTPMLTLS